MDRKLFLKKVLRKKNERGLVLRPVARKFKSTLQVTKDYGILKGAFKKFHRMK